MLGRPCLFRFVYFLLFFFFFNDTATPEIYTLSPHDAIPIHPDTLNMNKNSDPIGAIALDIGYPVITQEKLSIKLYAQAAKMLGETVHPKKGNGNLSLGTGLVPLGVSTILGPAQLRSEEHTSELQSQ